MVEEQNPSLRGGRLSDTDEANQVAFLKENPQFAKTFPKKRPYSFAYNDVIKHIPIQRTNGETDSPAYHTNQMVKHAFEDGHRNEAELKVHTDKMNGMSDEEAFEYAKKNLDFSKKYEKK